MTPYSRGQIDKASYALGTMHGRSSIPYRGYNRLDARSSAPDPNQLAKLMADIATGHIDERLVTEDGRDLAAVMMGRWGGLKGGRASAER